MREEELDIRSSNKTITLDGQEHQVLVRYFWDRVRNRINIVEVLNGRLPVYDQCSIGVRADLHRQIRREHLERCCRPVAEIAGNASLLAGGMR